MNINFSLTEQELMDIMTDSPVFRKIICKLLNESKRQKIISTEFPLESTFLNDLKAYCKRFNNSNKISGIQHVMQWSQDNRSYLHPDTVVYLNSLAGAKAFVEANMHYE